MESKAIQKLLKENFDFDVRNITPAKGGWSHNKKYWAELKDKPVFIRVNNTPYSLQTEAGIYLALHNEGIPTPHLLAIHTGTNKNDPSVVVMEKAKGTALNYIENTNIKRSLYKKAGALLRKLHNIHIPKWGRLRVSNGKLHGTASSWHQYLQEKNEGKNFSRLVKDNLITDKEYKKLVGAINELQSIRPAQPTFVHSDFHGEHIFSDGKKITGLIDVGNAFAGDPMYDVAMALYFIDSELGNALCKGYGNDAQNPAIKKYKVLIAARKTAWIYNKKLQNKITGSVQKLKRYLRDIT